MRTLLITLIISLFLNHRSFARGLASDTLHIRKNAGVKLYNPGTWLGFFAIGRLSFLDDHISFQVYDDDAFCAKNKLYRFNFLVKDFTISYNKIIKVKRGFFLIVPSKLVVKLDDHTKYKFDLLKGKKEAMRIIRSKMKRNMSLNKT